MRLRILALPMTSDTAAAFAGKIGLREPGEHTSGANVASGSNVAHGPLLTILKWPPLSSFIELGRYSDQPGDAQQVVRFRANRTLTRHRRMTGHDPEGDTGLAKSPQRNRSPAAPSVLSWAPRGCENSSPNLIEFVMRGIAE